MICEKENVKCDKKVKTSEWILNDLNFKIF